MLDTQGFRVKTQLSQKGGGETVGAKYSATTSKVSTGRGPAFRWPVDESLSCLVHAGSSVTAKFHRFDWNQVLELPGPRGDWTHWSSEGGLWTRLELPGSAVLGSRADGIRGLSLGSAPLLCGEGRFRASRSAQCRSYAIVCSVGPKGPQLAPVSSLPAEWGCERQLTLSDQVFGHS